MVTLTVDGINTILKLEYTVPTLKLNNILLKAIETIYNIYPMTNVPGKTYSQLTNAEKRGVLDDFFKWQMLQMSRTAIEKVEYETYKAAVSAIIEAYTL